MNLNFEHNRGVCNTITLPALRSTNTSQLQVAGPAVEALRYSGYNANLRELYSNKLQTQEKS